MGKVGKPRGGAMSGLGRWLALLVSGLRGKAFGVGGWSLRAYYMPKGL